MPSSLCSQFVLIVIMGSIYAFYLHRAFADHAQLPFAHYRLSNIFLRIMVRPCSSLGKLCTLTGCSPLSDGCADPAMHAAHLPPPPTPSPQAHHGGLAFGTIMLSLLLLQIIHQSTCWSYIDIGLGSAPVQVRARGSWLHPGSRFRASPAGFPPLSSRPLRGSACDWWQSCPRP